MTAVVEVTTATLEHRENCLCPKAARDLPAVMLDERSVASTPLFSGVILDRLARELEDRPGVGLGCAFSTAAIAANSARPCAHSIGLA